MLGRYNNKEKQKLQLHKKLCRSKRNNSNNFKLFNRNKDVSQLSKKKNKGHLNCDKSKQKEKLLKKRNKHKDKDKKQKGKNKK